MCITHLSNRDNLVQQAKIGEIRVCGGIRLELGINAVFVFPNLEELVALPHELTLLSHDRLGGVKPSNLAKGFRSPGFGRWAEIRLPGLGELCVVTVEEIHVLLSNVGVGCGYELLNFEELLPDFPLFSL